MKLIRILGLLFLGLTCGFLVQFFFISFAPGIRFNPLNLGLCLIWNLPVTLIHESGHVLFGLLAGIPIYKVIIGQGNILREIEVGRLVIEFRRRLLLGGGMTVSDNITGKRLKTRLFVYQVGGMLAQALVALVLSLLFPRALPGFFTRFEINLPGALSAWLLFTLLLNLLPRQISRNKYLLYTDGMQLIKLLTLGPADLSEYHRSGDMFRATERLQKGELAAARDAFRQISEKNPGNFSAGLNESVALIRMLDFSGAAGVLQRLRQQKRAAWQEGLLINNLLWARMLQNPRGCAELDLLKGEAQELLHSRGKNPFLKGTYYILLLLRGEPEKAAAFLRQQRLYPWKMQGHPLLRFFYGYYWCLKGNYRKAARFISAVEANQNLSEDEKYLIRLLREETCGFTGPFNPPARQ